MNKHYIGLAALLSILLVACNPTDSATQTSGYDAVKQEQSQNYQLLGKKGKIEFPEATAYVTYHNAKSLHWRTVDKQGVEAEGTESMDFKAINNHTFFLNWVEQDGFTVSQIIDTKNGTVAAYWSYHDEESNRGKRGAMFVEGKFSFR